MPFIKEQTAGGMHARKFESTADVMAAMKEMFADVLQQVMECELEQKLGYEKKREGVE